jgi:hypothetical protein
MAACNLRAPAASAAMTSVGCAAASMVTPFHSSVYGTLLML